MKSTRTIRMPEIRIDNSTLPDIVPQEGCHLMSIQQQKAFYKIFDNGKPKII